MPKISITPGWLEQVAADDDKPATLPAGVEREKYWDTALPGFGVLVGQRFATFLVQHRVNGKQKLLTIGRYGRPGAGEDHADRWTVARARKRALELLGRAESGEDMAPEQADEKTLRDAFELHKKKLKKKGRSEQTVSTLEKSMAYVEDWLDRPISALTGEVLADLHDQIKEDARPTKGARNEKGAPLANRVITNVGTVWATLNKQLQGKLGNWNPAKSVDKDKLKPKRTRVEDLADWWKRVQTMRNPIQRDGLVFALFTGLRNEDVRTVRYEHVDSDARTLRLPDPKGGEDREFTIPLPTTCLEIVERRRKMNAAALGRDDGDHGWVFPGFNGAGEIGPIGDLRQQMHSEQGHSRFPAEDVHTLRRTYLSVAHDAGVSELDQHVLTNHSFGSANVNQTYIRQHMDTLRACQHKIEAAIKAKIDPEPQKLAEKKKSTKRDRHLRSVPV